jgi:hypothetical protein
MYGNTMGGRNPAPPKGWLKRVETLSTGAG